MITYKVAAMIPPQMYILLVVVHSVDILLLLQYPNSFYIHQRFSLLPVVEHQRQRRNDCKIKNCKHYNNSITFNTKFETNS